MYYFADKILSCIRMNTYLSYAITERENLTSTVEWLILLRLIGSAAYTGTGTLRRREQSHVLQLVSDFRTFVFVFVAAVARGCSGNAEYIVEGTSQGRLSAADLVCTSPVRVELSPELQQDINIYSFIWMTLRIVYTSVRCGYF